MTKTSFLQGVRVKNKGNLSRILAAALLTFAGITAPAIKGYARDGNNATAFGIAGGIIGLGLLEAAADAEARRNGYPYAGARCYPGPQECEYVERPCFYNDFGDQICPAPFQRCFRRPICE